MDKLTYICMLVVVAASSAMAQNASTPTTVEGISPEAGPTQNGYQSRQEHYDQHKEEFFNRWKQQIADRYRQNVKDMDARRAELDRHETQCIDAIIHARSFEQLNEIHRRCDHETEEINRKFEVERKKHAEAFHARHEALIKQWREWKEEKYRNWEKREKR